MPPREVLVLAITKMLSGICTAGFTLDPHPVTGLRWVRPVREHDTLLPGDMTYADGSLVCCCDVIELNLHSPRRDPPHVEDWITDFVHTRPRLLRRLEGQKRARFLSQHIDKAPEEVLIQNARSLCLVHPSRIWASFSLDSYSGKYEARMGFALHGGAEHPRAASAHGVSVTDLRWRALGRTWLAEGGGVVHLDHQQILGRLGAEEVYLALGLSRPWRGELWPLVIGVHVVPDYEVALDGNNL